jgi:site-specific recombinase XerD
VNVSARPLTWKSGSRGSIGRISHPRLYRYCVEEELLSHNPATNVRRPRLCHEATILGLDRNELGAFLVQAGLSGARDHALACLLALNGPRVSEALYTNFADVGLERGHHTLRVRRKGGKTVSVPLAPRTARTVYLAIGERTEGPSSPDPMGGG